MRCARWIGIVLALALAAAGCARAPADVASSPGAPAYVRDLPPADFHQYLQDHLDAFILDVRMEPEWDGDLGHLDNATLIPFEQLETRAAELPPDHERPIAVYDRLGSRSGSAAQQLARLGYREIVPLQGGLDAYRHAGY